MEQTLAVRIAGLAPVTVTGTWQRHSSAALPDHALSGRAAYGRWGTRGGFPVLYLGRPLDSVIVEAYRHLIDPVENPALLAEIGARLLVTTTVHISDVLDLRSAAARFAVGLSISDLTSATDDRDAYTQCQRIAEVAHQLGRHGIIAPAATALGDTLALFTDHVAAAGQTPLRATDDILWNQLPPDPRQAGTPRHLRVVINPDA